MSRILKVTPEIVEQVRQEFEKALLSAKMLDGKFSFSKTFDAGTDRAVIRFSPEAYAKMVELVKAFDKEVAWHLVCERGEEDGLYLVSDIIVYPQSITAATVEMDLTEYNKWIAENIAKDDDRFFHICGQGHSHVNMATSPSNTDMDHQKKVLADLRPNGFYIFVIWNKRNEHTLWVYDLAKNTVFEDKDITLQIGDYDLTGFIEEAKTIVKPKTYQTQVTGFPSKFGYGGYGYGGYGTAQQTKPEEKPAKQAAAPASPKQKEKVRAVLSAPLYPHNAWDDDDDPSSPFYAKDYYYGLE